MRGPSARSRAESTLAGAARACSAAVALAGLLLVAAADAAAGAVYYSVGTSVADLKSGAPTVTISSGVATFSIAQPNNVGVGDQVTYNGATIAYISGRTSSTRYALTTATGGVPANIVGATVNQIRRAFNLLSGAVAGSSDAAHLNTANLVAANVQLNWACYNDGPMDDQVKITGYTTDASNYIRVFTPVSAGQVGASQRHKGKARTGFRLQPTGAVDGDSIIVEDSFVRIEGIEIDGSLSTAPNGAGGVDIETGATAPVGHYVSHNIIYATRNFTGIYVDATSARVWNNVLHEVDNVAFGALAMNQAAGTAYFYNNTVFDHAGSGIALVAGTLTAKNNVSMNKGSGSDFAGAMTQSNNVSGDASAAGAGSQVNKTAYATYFKTTTVGSEDLHLVSSSAALWGSSGADLSADANLPVTDDIDGERRLAPDIGADEFGVCCSLSTAEVAGSTVTVTGANQFEVVFNTLRGGGIDDFFDLAEDPGRTLDLAGRDSLNLWGLFHTSMEVPAGTLYTTGTNSSGAKVDLLEATPVRVKVRQESFYQRVLPLTAILPGVKGIGDYSVYGQRVALRWNRTVTGTVPDQDDHALEITAHREAAGVLNPMNLYSQSGSVFPAPATDDFVLAQREVAGSPGVRTDFLGIQSSDWAAADSLTASTTGAYFSWRDTTDNQALAAGLDEKWNFLIHYKPTNFVDNTAPSPVSLRSADYRTHPAAEVVINGGKGSQWADPAEATVAGTDWFNEAEAAYPLQLDQAQGLDFTLDGATTARYTPFFKIRQWRSFVEAPVVSFDADAGGPGLAVALAKDAGYKAAVKPLSRAYFTSSLRWHCTLDDNSVTNTCSASGIDLDVGSSGGVSGVTMVPARYGFGAAFDANTDSVSAPSNALAEFDPGSGAVEFWYQPNLDHTASAPLVFWRTSSVDDCFVFEKTGTNALLFTIRKGAASNCTSGGTIYQVSLPSGSYSWRAKDWVHLRTTWTTASFGRMAIWLNGVELAFNTGYNAATVSSGSTLVFGGCSASCPLGSAGNADGILDELLIYGGPSEPTSIAHAGRVGAADEYLADSGFNYPLDLARVDAARRGRYLYFGADSKFLGLNVSLATAGAGVADSDVVWQYWRGGSGAWVALSPSDGTKSFKQTGTVSWTDPSGWTPMSLSGGPDLYYVRAHLPAAAAADYTTIPVERVIKTDILLFQYCRDVTTAATFAFAVPPTTAVKLASFTATAGDGAVRLEWRTGSELENLGFHLYRSLSADGPWTRLTDSLIAGLGSSALGQAYSWLDAGLQNGTRYFYRLEDVDTSSKATAHGPVSAVPQAGAVAVATGAGADGSGGGRTAGGGSCPAWVVSAYGSLIGSTGSAGSLACTRHGDPEAVSLAVLSRDARQATLELRTGGFYALHGASGRVHVFVPGFDFPQDAEAAALPFRRALVDAVVGRRVELGGVRASDQLAFRGLVPDTLGQAEMQVSQDGTVRAERRAQRAIRGEARATRGAVRERVVQRSAQLDLARLLPSVFQGETKSAVVEIVPLRYDARRGQLLLAKRVRVRLLFAGRDTGESGRGSVGRRERPHKPASGQLLARLFTTRAGLYAVAFEQVFPGQKRGLAASELRLERQGEAVSFHLEPASGSFGPGSVIYFHADRTAASTDFSSEVAYELVRSRDGVQMPLVAAAPAGDAVTSALLAEAPFEVNRFYQPGLLEAPDLWLWEALGSGVTRAKSFTLGGVDAASSQTAEVEVFLQGASESGNPVDHHVSVSLNGTPVGEAQFAGKKPYRMSLSLPASLLREGANELQLTNVADTGVSSFVFLDRFTIAHPQLSSLAGGRFAGWWAESGSVSVSASGAVSGPVRIVDVTAPVPVWLTGFEHVAGTVRFRAEAGHRYWVGSDSALMSPRVSPVQASTLKSAVNQADYLLIAPRAFLVAAEPLLQRRADQGLQARAVAFEEIADEFGHGQPSAEAIKSFLAYAFQSWARPSPRYVLLLGDSTYDPRNFIGTSQASPLPALWTRTSYLWTVSDPLLAAVNGEDSLPDLAIGRLPAASTEQAQRLVEKLLAWEDSGQGLNGAAALVADNPDQAGDFEADVDDIAASFLQGRDVGTLKLSALGGETRTAIREALDSGLSLLSYVGHGGAAVWASENVWNSWDAASLLAQSGQPLLLTLNCLNGYFVAPAFDSLSESLLKAEGRGAVASISPSGLSLDGPAHQYHRALMAELTGGQHQRLGDALAAAQAAYARSGLMPELLSIYHLLGDPAMPIR